ncbi:peroxiredoxin [Coralliovum pocilloporae]|uniref:peroxiredoxin n=1 Tax=Coralliovum pocilloporae TaxID=3066369 RepID=UPI003306F92E
MNQPNLQDVDWSTIPAPEDDGGADHLKGRAFPAVPLRSTDGNLMDLSALSGLVILFVYPMTGQPGVALPEDWDMIPGARGCTPQSCGFRDLAAELKEAGADHIFGLSTQDTDYQKEMAERLHMPFPILSDSELALQKALNLPMMRVHDMDLLKRMALILKDGEISKVFYPVFPPDRNAPDVLEWLKGR